MKPLVLPLLRWENASTIGDVTNPRREPLDPGQRARLREGMAKMFWGNAQLAKATGKTPNTIGNILNGESAPQQGTLQAMCDALKMNIAYVVLDEGPAFIEPKAASAVELRAVDAPLGLDRWLAESAEGKGASLQEIAHLRGVTLPDPHFRYPDVVYHYLLAAFREALRGRHAQSGQGQT